MTATESSVSKYPDVEQITQLSEVREARKRLLDAVYSMHVDQRLRISMDVAKELGDAWDAYHEVLIDKAREGWEPKASVKV